MGTFISLSPWSMRVALITNVVVPIDSAVKANRCAPAAFTSANCMTRGTAGRGFEIQFITVPYFEAPEDRPIQIIPSSLISAEASGRTNRRPSFPHSPLQQHPVCRSCPYDAVAMHLGGVFWQTDVYALQSMPLAPLATVEDARPAAS